MKNNEITIYHNDLNRVVLRRWKSEEKNIFMALVTKLRNQGTNRVILEANEIKDLINFGSENSSRYYSLLEDTIGKILQISYIERSEKRIRAMNLFSFLEIDLEDQTIEAEVSSQYSYILNKLNAEFTTLELSQFINLKSTYSKTMYQLLRERKSLGVREFSVDEFRLILDIPKSYNIGMINRQIVNTVIQELTPLFDSLKVKTIKKNTRGTPVIGYKFTWNAQKSSENKWIEDKYNKKSKKPKLAEDTRMTREERKKFTEEKMRKRQERFEKEEQAEGQIDATFYDPDYKKD